VYIVVRIEKMTVDERCQDELTKRRCGDEIGEAAGRRSLPLYIWLSHADI
jgi:hypothetical protein